MQLYRKTMKKLTHESTHYELDKQRGDCTPYFLLKIKGHEFNLVFLPGNFRRNLNLN